MVTKSCLSAVAVTGNWDNAALLERAGQGNQLAWKQLVEQYDGLVRSVSRSFRLQTADVHDVVQTTWLRLMQNLHTIRDPERLAGWLAVTAARESLSVLRKASTHDLNPKVDEAADPTVDPGTSVADSDTARVLWEAVADLPPRQRLIVMALFQDDLDSYRDVAAKCTMPIGSIGPSRARALSHLRRKLEDRGLDPFDR